MDVPYYLCGRRDANVNVCRQLCNWMCQPTSQLTLLNLQLCFTLWSRRGCRGGTAARRPEDRLLSASWLQLHFSLLLKNFLRAAGVTMRLGLPPDRKSAASRRSLDSCWCLDDCAGPFHETQNSETDVTAPKSHPLYSEALFSSLTLLCLSPTSSYGQSALQSRRDMTADECEHPQPHKWKLLICHSSFQGGIFCSPPPPHSRKG